MTASRGVPATPSSEPSTPDDDDADAGPSTGVTPPSDDDHPGAGSTGTMRRKQVRGSALLVVGRVLTLLLTTATQIVIVRALSKTDFGGFAYALALAAGCRVLLSLGQGKLLSRFMAKYEERRDYDRMFGSMALAVGTILATSTVLIAGVYLFSDALVGSAIKDAGAMTIVLILVFLSPLEALDQVFISMFAVFSAPGAIFFRKYLLTPALRLAVVLALALTGSSVTFLAIGYVAAGVVGLGVSVVVFLQVLRERDLLRHLRPRSIIMPVKSVFAFSMPLITGELLLLSFTIGGVIILGFHHTAAEVASYRAVFNPARLNTAVLGSFMPLFLPLSARLFERKDITGLREAYWHTAAFVAVLTFPIFALTGPLADTTTVVLFGERYADSGLILSLLSLGYYFSTMLGFNAYTLQVCAKIKFLVGVNVSVAVLNIVLSLLLVQQYGAVGIASANLVALVAQNALNQWALRRAINTSLIDRGCLQCYLVIVACAAGLWVFQAVAHPNFVLGFAAATVASLVVLVASRSAIELEQTFPELARIPVIRWLVR